MMDHSDPEVVEPRLPDPDSLEPVAYGPEKPKRDFIPEPAIPRRRVRWPWIVLGCLLAPCICCALSVGGVAAGGAVLAAIFDSNKVTESGTNTLDLSEDGPFQLKVSSQVGSVEIRTGGDAGEVTVEWTKTASSFTEDRARARLAEMSVDVTESSGTVAVSTIASGKDFFWFNTNEFELVITVPDDLDGVTLNHNVGDVVFAGQIDGEGPYSFKTNVGSIRLDLDPDTVARVDAETDVGSISVNGFNPSSQPSEAVPGEAWNDGAIGGAGDDDPLLRLRVNVGDITIQPQ